MSKEINLRLARSKGVEKGHMKLFEVVNEPENGVFDDSDLQLISDFDSSLGDAFVACGLLQKLSDEGRNVILVMNNKDKLPDNFT